MHAMPATEPIDLFQLVGTTLEGRFVVERVVAEGGFGVVYRAEQVALERPIALKVLKTPARFDEDERRQFLKSFAAEAKTIARIDHPNIVHVYDFGVSDMPSGVRAAWMALEWLTGVTLEEELLARRGRGGRSPAECLSLLKPVLSALAVVHAEGVAHRDIKPANIMLVQGPNGPRLKLVDFGIAKIMETDEAPGPGQTLTRSNRVAFSPGYAAPEQISNGRTGPWTDVHAIGLILSELLTDSPPFEAGEMAVLFQQIVDRSRPTPSKRGYDVGPWEAVLTRSLAVASVERFRDAGELLRALEAAVPHASSVRVSVAPGPGQIAPSSSPTFGAMATQMDAVASGPLPRVLVATGGPLPPNPSRASLAVTVGALVVGGLGAAWILSGGMRGEPSGVDTAGAVPSVPPARPLSAARPPTASIAEAVAPSAVPPPQPSASAPPPRPALPRSTAASTTPPPAVKAPAPPPSAKPSASPALPVVDTMH